MLNEGFKFNFYVVFDQLLSICSFWWYIGCTTWVCTLGRGIRLLRGKWNYIWWLRYRFVRTSREWCGAEYKLAQSSVYVRRTICILLYHLWRHFPLEQDNFETARRRALRLLPEWLRVAADMLSLCAVIFSCRMYRPFRLVFQQRSSRANSFLHRKEL